MKALQARILEGRYGYMGRYDGQEVTILTISDHCGPTGGFQMRGVTRGGLKLLVYSDELVPMDLSGVPQTHMGSLVLQQAWVFSTAKNDAWNHHEPTDKVAWEEKYGFPWKDVRVWDVGRM